MSTLNQQTLAESGASGRPPILEKGSYVPWASQFKRLMHGYEVTEQVRHSRLMNEFEKFVVLEGGSLASVYVKLTTLINVMDRNKVCPLPISLNTKFLNSLQPEWSKYVSMTRQNHNLKEIEYDNLFDTLSQYEPHVNASKAKKAAKNHDPLALVAHSNVYSSQSHASPSYSHSPQPYYVTHPSLVVDYDDDCQGEVDIQSKNVGYAGNGNRNAGRQNRNQAANVENGLCYNFNAKDHYARDCPKPKVRDTKYFREHMLLAMKDEAGGTLNAEENDFMLDNAYGDNTLEELTVALIMMARIQPTDDKGDAEPKYDAEAISEENASQINLISGMLSKGVHEHTDHEKLKTVINTSVDDQIDANIIFDDPYVENNGGTDEHDSNAHD
ncbi:integrase, catalytic region, zinc finger, CCHC-type containing protein [Tanacetum coccineum]